MPEPYQYGVQRSGVAQTMVETSKAFAENAARDWVISPLRTGPRWAKTMRRRGYDGVWEELDTWTTPESQATVAVLHVSKAER